VDPSHLRRRIGRALFTAAAKVIARAGHRQVRLGTIFPATLAFYRAMGMCESGRKTVGFGPMVGVEVILLRKPVDCRSVTESQVADG